MHAQLQTSGLETIRSLSQGEPNDYFNITLTTSSAYRLPLSSMLTAHFYHQEWLGAHQYEAVETCLHEALLNAIIHGNLEIKSDYDSLLSFERFRHRIDAQLKISSFARRPVTIRLASLGSLLQLFITHYGNRFTGGIRLSDSHAHGRGLQIIKLMSTGQHWLNDGKTMQIDFL